MRSVIIDMRLEQVENHIFTIREKQVILDKDLAILYGTTTKRLNEQVRRNISRFPAEFMFQITQEEWDSLRSQIATIYTRTISDQLALDISKHDSQYSAIPVQLFNKAHDRFLIIDDKVYHVGASIKDLGKKWFAILEMEGQDPNQLISKI